MIEVTKENVDKSKFLVNVFQVNTVGTGRENKAVITMSNGVIFTVLESKDKVEELVMLAKQKVFGCRGGSN